MAISFGRTVNVLFSRILPPVSGPIRLGMNYSKMFLVSGNRYDFTLAGYRNGKSAIDPPLVFCFLNARRNQVGGCV